MTIAMRLSRRDRAEILAEERDLTAWHEAGHAVAHAVARLPFHDARIWVETRRRGQRRERHWAGAVRLAPDDGGVWVLDEQLPAFVVAMLAGPEVEARRVHQAHGRRVPLPEIRASLVEDHDYADEDWEGLPELLTVAGVTRAEAELRTIELVTAWWPQITRVAGILHTTGAMTSAEVTAVVHGTGSTATSPSP